MLAAASGALALVVASWSERLLSAFSLPAPIPQRLHMHVDGRVIAFTALLVLVAGVLPGLLPALQATRRDLALSIRLDAAQRPSRVRHLFVAAQIAGSTLFLATALLFVRSFANATRADVGFDPNHMIVARLEPALYGFDGARTPALARTLVERIAAIPGLTAAIADRAPFAVGYPRTDRVSTPGRACVAPACKPTTFYAVDANYFAASGVRLRAGRPFDHGELARGDAVIVNDVMAEALWPGRSPIGETVSFDGSHATATVVGVITNASSTLSLGGTPISTFYRPIGEPDFANGFTLIVRSSADDAAATSAIRDTVHAAAPALPIASLQTMHEMLELPMWPRRTAAGVFSICGMFALVLATVGLFGVTYFAVRQRTREFGIRMAIGARPRQLVAQVLGEGARFVVPGALAGLLLAAIAARVLSGLLLGVSPADPTSFATAGLLEIAVAGLACAIPARDASRVDPLIALRND